MAPLWILAALALTGAAYFASAVLIPLAVSFFLAILLEPLVAACEARGLRRGRGAALVVLVFFCAAGGAVWGFSQPFSSIVSEMPQYTDKIRLAASDVDRRVHAFLASAGLGREEAPRLGAAAPAPAEGEGVNSWSQFFWRGLGSIFAAAGIAAFVPFLMIVMLSEKRLLIEGLKRLAGSSWDVGRAEHEASQMVRAYFSGNFLAGAAMATLHWLLFAVLGLKNAVGLGLVAGLLTLIPLIGLPAALLLPTAQGLLQFDRVWPFVALALCLSGLHLLTANYVMPAVIGGRVKINATAATTGLLFWGWLWGVTGFVLAVPLTALLKILLASGKDTEPYSSLLAATQRPFRHGFVRRWLTAARETARFPAPR